MIHILASSASTQTDFPLAIIVSKFNRELTEELQKGALRRLTERGFTLNQVILVEVPGAIEIPLIASRLAKTKRYAVILHWV